MAMVPRIGEEMRRPEVPSWTYSTFVDERLARREGGVGRVGGGIVFVVWGGLGGKWDGVGFLVIWSGG